MKRAVALWVFVPSLLFAAQPQYKAKTPEGKIISITNPNLINQIDLLFNLGSMNNKYDGLQTCGQRLSNAIKANKGKEPTAAEMELISLKCGCEVTLGTPEFQKARDRLIAKDPNLKDSEISLIESRVNVGVKEETTRKLSIESNPETCQKATYYGSHMAELEQKLAENNKPSATEQKIIKVAENFLALLKSGQCQKAYEMTGSFLRSGRTVKQFNGTCAEVKGASETYKFKSIEFISDFNSYQVNFKTSVSGADVPNATYVTLGEENKEYKVRDFGQLPDAFSN
jgi:hypothetical protein